MRGVRFTNPRAEKRILNLRFRTDDLPFELRHASSVANASLFFEVEFGTGSTLELEDQNVGAVDLPFDLQSDLSDVVRFTPYASPQLDELFELQFTDDSPAPKMGCSVLWVKATRYESDVEYRGPP